MHEVTRSLRLGAAGLALTLDAVAAGVVNATTFTVAAVNLVRSDGAFTVVSVHGSPEAREALLGVVEPAERWMELIDEGIGWGSLLYVPHDSPLPSNTAMTTWRDSYLVPDDPQIWNPLDSLIAPLYAADHTVLGAISVDLPTGATRPGNQALELLEVLADHAAAAIERATNTRKAPAEAVES